MHVMVTHHKAWEREMLTAGARMTHHIQLVAQELHVDVGTLCVAEPGVVDACPEALPLQRHKG